MRIKYYLSSFKTLYQEIENPFCLSKLPFEPQIVRFKKGYLFKIRSLLDLWVIKEVCLDDDYERLGISIKDGWSILDIGAGVGDFSVHVAKRFPECMIFAFEPNPETYKILLENIALNKVVNVTAVNKAVTGKETHKLYLGSSSSLDSTEPEEGKKVVEIESINLNTILSETRCDLLKMDCEGAEYGILFSLTSDFIEKINNIILEWHDDGTNHHSDLINYLKSNGFTLRITSNPIHSHIGFLSASKDIKL